MTVKLNSIEVIAQLYKIISCLLTMERSVLLLIAENN